ADQGHRLPDDAQPAAGRRDLPYDAQVLDLGVGEHLVDRMDRPARNARLVESIDPLGAGAAGQIGLQLGVESVAVLEARRGGGVLRPLDWSTCCDLAA